MNNPKEWNLWRSDMFIQCEGKDKGFIYPMWAFVVGGLGCIPVAGLAISVSVLAALLLTAFLLTAIVFGPHMSRIHPLYRVKNERYEYEYNLYYRGKEYLSLSKADKALYPPNIIQAISNPHLTRQQKSMLDRTMKSVYTEILARDKARDALSYREANVDDILEALRDSKRSVEVETKTYLEYGGK